jgi:hypothetical protein
LTVFRIAVGLLPQILALLLLGGQFDLLGGWNKTDAAFGILIVLFLATPLATALLMAFEVLNYRHRKRKQETVSLLMPGIGIFLFIEALALDALLLSLARLH